VAEDLVAAEGGRTGGRTGVGVRATAGSSPADAAG